MVYEWKTGYFSKVAATDAGNELERIRTENGELTSSSVVDASRPEDAVLHKCFEWDNSVAAERYREYQAGSLIRNIVIREVAPESPRKAEPVRAFVHIENDYKPIKVVTASVEYTNTMLENAKREMLMFKQKYIKLAELAGVMSAIDAVFNKETA